MKFFRKVLRFDVLVILVIFGWALAMVVDRMSFTYSIPESLDKYIQAEGFKSVYSVRRNSDVYYVFTEGPKLYFLASGPVAFVFNEEGELVDHDYDIGDSMIFRDKWGSVSDWEEVPKSQVLDIIGSKRHF